MKGRIKVGSKVITAHIPPIRGICTRITSRGSASKEYLIAYNDGGTITVSWLDPCEVSLIGDTASNVGFHNA